ncbi:hypothetical protein KVR01_000671 [Diaporthe batatas]|uniref:uncharacterized protein n=1 Tax=Diaporthe batatas TaxID=748121 RepID=UPI001D0501C1|nr:uncharacterized protein KVR01_000671 [Diaporthe batatas]KAG8169926.1 hypothetical protein KVR01_000671 [Diaporthe batatas]
MALRFDEPPSPERLGRSETWIDPLGIIWVGTPTRRSHTFGFEYGSQHPLTFSDDEREMYPPQEMEQAPFPYNDRGPQPWGFPPPPPLRLCDPRLLAKLRFPNDVPVQVLERMKYRGFRRYVNYPTRLFHLRPQSNLEIPEDLDWETAFLWRQVSSSLCRADWIEEFPYPALDMPLPYFPEALLQHGQTIRTSKLTPEEGLEFAAAVCHSAARGPSDPEPNFNVEWKDIRKMAIGVVGQLERQGNPGAAAMAASMREQRRDWREYDSFFRFRDWNHKPTGMGFRGTRDLLFLDDDYLTDFLKRASQDGAASVRMRPDVKLIPFLAGPDAAKVTAIMVSAKAFRDPEARTYLCYAIARAFPRLHRLRLTSIGTVASDVAERLGLTPDRWFKTGELGYFAQEEMRRNGGSSYVRRAREDAEARFDTAGMSPALMRATGAYADGRGRSLAGDLARTPLVAYGIGAGLMHDPEPRAPADHEGGRDPPFIAAVQHMLTAAFRVVARRREACAAVARAEARARRAGWPTMLPRPVPLGPAWGVWSADRSYRRCGMRPQDFRWWAEDHIARERRRHAHAQPEHFSSEAEPQPAHSVPYARVEATVLIYDRDAYDRNVYGGWTGFAPGVDLSYFP